MKTATMNPNPATARDYFADKMAFTTGPVELHHQIDEGEPINIVDVRATEDYEKGHIPGARNLPQDQWSDTTVLQREGMNVLYCYSATCHLAAKAAMRFAERGFPVMEMEGGFEAWEENDLPIEK